MSEIKTITKAYSRYFKKPVKIYLFKVTNRKTRKMFETCSKLPIKTSEQRREQLILVYLISFKLSQNMLKIYKQF